MPSQRLLTILDPTGHLPARVVESRAPKAVVWTTARRRDGVARELREAGVAPLVAGSLRHLAASVQPAGPSYAPIAVIELAALGPDEVSVLETARWSGYRGTLIAIAPAGVDARLRAVIGVDSVVDLTPGALTGALARRVR